MEYKMDGHKKEEIITFKVDGDLARAMAGIPNRSEFIRSAILASLDSTCPLCSGTGMLTPRQKKHWIRFSKNHSIEECETCHAYHIVCGAQV
jgi:hypothetical protein